MRTIKFKAKTSDGEWVEGCVYESNYSQYIKHPKSNTADEIDPNTLCQFTGLTDKNGVEIYEGDKVIFECWIPKVTIHADVEYLCDEARFMLKSCEPTFYLFSDAYANTIEVIGNIHNKIDER